MFQLGSGENGLVLSLQTGNMEQQISQLRGKIEQLSKAGVSAVKVVTETSKAFGDQREELGRLIGRIDPVIGKLGELDKMEEKLRAAQKSGILPKDDFEVYAKKISSLRSEIDGTAAAQEKMRKRQEEAAKAFSSFVTAVDPASAALERLAEKERQLSSYRDSGKITGDQYTRYAKTLAAARSELDGTAAAQEKMRRSQQSELSMLGQLRDRMDPLGAQAQKVAKEISFVNEQFSKRNIGATEHARLISNLKDEQKELERLRSVEKKVSSAAGGTSSAQRRMADRYLPNQIHDGLRQIEAGASPLNAILQQGSQIKDMYGSVGGALKGVGSYLLSMLNPAILVGGALAGVAYSVYKISSAFSETKNQIMLAGRSYQDFKNLQSNVIDVHKNAPGVSLSTASSAVAAASSNAGVAYGDITKVATVAAEANHILGKSVKSTVEEYGNLKSGGVDSIVSINDQYGFLTASQFEQVRALSDQGKAIEAGALAQDLYTEKMKQAVKEAEENLPAMERMWKNVSTQISNAGNGLAIMMGYGSKRQELQMQIDNAEAHLANSKSSVGTFWGKLDGTTEETVKKAQARLDALKATAKTMDDLANGQNETEKNSKAEVHKKNDLANLKYANLSSDDKRVADRKKLAAQLKEAGATEAETAKALAGFDENHKKTEKSASHAGESLLTQVKQQGSELQLQLKALEQNTGDLSESEKAIAKFDQRLADIRKSGAKSDGDKEIVKKAAAIRAELEDNSLIEEGIRLQKEKNEAIKKQAENHKEALKAIKDINEATALASETRAMGSTSATRYSQIKAVKSDPSLSEDDRQKKLEALKNSYKEVDAAQGDWKSSAYRAWDDFSSKVGDVSSTVNSSLTSAFGTAQSAVANFVKTGKLSFSDLASSAADAAINIGMSFAMKAGMSYFGMGGAFAKGGYVEPQRRAGGGMIYGAGNGTSDSIPALLSNGEMVINAAQTARHRGLLERINNGQLSRFATGGAVDGSRYNTSAQSGGGVSINMGGVTIQANSKEEGAQAMDGVLESALKNVYDRSVGASRQFVIDQTVKPSGIINKAIKGK